MPIESLLARRDNVQVVRDQIATILALELEHQKTVLAAPAPHPRVFVERASPWGVAAEDPADLRPLLNVWFDTGSFEGSASNSSERQRFDVTINIDAYAFAVSSADGAGHLPGDEAAALECQTTIGYARQILMASLYTYLGMRGVVWRRWTQSITVFQPQSDERATTRVVAARLALAVQLNEFSPQVEGVALETLSVEVLRKENGEVYFAGRYPT